MADAAAKWLTVDTPTGEIIFGRGIATLLCILVLIARAGPRVLRPNNARGIFERAAVAVLFTFFLMASLRELPIAEVIAILYASPLILAAIAPSLLRETVGLHRWIALFIAFAGVLVMMRPGAETLRWVALLPLAAAFIGAFRDVLTRRVAGTETSLAIQFYTTLAMIVFGGVTIVFGWRALPWGRCCTVDAMRRVSVCRPIFFYRCVSLRRGDDTRAIQILDVGMGADRRLRDLGRHPRRVGDRRHAVDCRQRSLRYLPRPDQSRIGSYLIGENDVGFRILFSCASNAPISADFAR